MQHYFINLVRIDFRVLVGTVLLVVVLSSNAWAQLPLLSNWIPGDAHVHTQFSLWDANYDFGEILGPTIAEQVQAAKNRVK